MATMLSTSQFKLRPQLNGALEIDRSGLMAGRSPNIRVASPSVCNVMWRERAPLHYSTSGSPWSLELGASMQILRRKQPIGA